MTMEIQLQHHCAVRRKEARLRRAESTPTPPAGRCRRAQAHRRSGCPHRPCQAVSLWASRDPIAERGGRGLYSFLANATIAGYDARGLCRCVITDPLEIKLAPPNSPSIMWWKGEELQGPADNPVWNGSYDKDQDGNPDGYVAIWFTIRAVFNKCCEFRQERRGKIARDGKVVANIPNFEDDGYNRMEGARYYMELESGLIMLADHDNPNAGGPVKKDLSLWMGFKGYIVDICPDSPTYKKKIGPEKRYGWQAVGKLADGIYVNPYGFDN